MVLSNLSQRLRRYPSAHFIRSLAQRLVEPRKEFQYQRDFRAFSRDTSHLFVQKRRTEGGNRVLFVSLMGDFVGGAKIEAFFVQAMLLKGCEPIVLTNRGSWVNRYYRLFGVRNFVYFEDFLADVPYERIEKEVSQAIEALRTFDDLMVYEFNGVKVGKYVCSSLVRRTHTGHVDLEEPATRAQLKEYLVKAVETSLVADNIFRLYKPASTIFLERGYSPYGEFFDLSLRHGINTLQWCGSHLDSALILKRYASDNVDQHPASLSSKTWKMLEQSAWDEGKAQLVQKELFDNYSAGKWFSEVGTQFNTRIYEAGEIKRVLGLDPQKKTGVIFSHLFWDATFFWGTDLFENYQEWFIESVKAACANQNLNWIVKLHPANVVKLNRDGYKDELIEKQVLAKHIGTLPSHVKLLEPNTPINTYSLFNGVMDYCFTVRGTIGIEAAFFGIPVITAGTGRYDSHGFTLDSSHREEYLRRIAEVHTYPRLTPRQRELAQKFAYGTFILRPFVLRDMRISYSRDQKATQKTEYLVTSRTKLEASADLSKFSDWALGSDDQDYLNKEHDGLANV